jgi:translation initiation factor eIF-2B subunit epsilon
LAALYQTDIIEEKHIRDWHNKPKSMGLGLKDSVRAENMKSCWAVGERMIQQFDEQDSESE